MGGGRDGGGAGVDGGLDWKGVVVDAVPPGPEVFDGEGEWRCGGMGQDGGGVCAERY